MCGYDLNPKPCAPKCPSGWRCRPKVWTAYDVIKQAGYPVERHRGIRTDDDYRMEMVRIFRKGDCCLAASGSIAEQL